MSVSLADTDRIDVDRIVRHALPDEALGSAELVSGGLINTLFRVTTANGTDYALRLYSGTDGPSRCARELRTLEIVGARIPIPGVVASSRSTAHVDHTFIVYRWIDGLTLNECRRNHGAAAMDSIARELGVMLGTLACTPASSAIRLPALSSTDMLAIAESQLRSSRVGEQLGPSTADAFRARLARSANALIRLDESPVLVHGDMGGRNIIVRERSPGDWTISGVIDWENAAVGSALWDIGSLARYPGRYSSQFYAHLERGYIAAGASLPDEWLASARLLDATRLIRVLAEDDGLPRSVYDDCVSVIASLI